MVEFNRFTLRLSAKSAQKEFRSYLAEKVSGRMKVMWVIDLLGVTIPSLYNLWQETPGSKTRMVFVFVFNFLFLLTFLTRYYAKTDFFIHTIGISLVLSFGAIMNLIANDMLFDEPSVNDCPDSVMNLEMQLMLVVFASYILLSTDFLQNSIWIPLFFFATSMLWRVAREECYEGELPGLFYAIKFLFIAVMTLAHYAHHLTYTEMFVMYQKSNSQNE